MREIGATEIDDLLLRRMYSRTERNEGAGYFPPCGIGPCHYRRFEYSGMPVEHLFNLD